MTVVQKSLASHDEPVMLPLVMSLWQPKSSTIAMPAMALSHTCAFGTENRRDQRISTLGYTASVAAVNSKPEAGT